MKKHTLLFLSFLFIYTGMRASWEPDTIANPRFIIKTPVLAFIDQFGGLSYRLGAEFKIAGTFSGCVEGGSYFYLPQDHRKGAIVRLEFKGYRDEEKCVGQYFSLEYLYKNVSFDFADSIAIPNKPKYETPYRIHKEISCLTFKWGDLEIYKKRLVFEWYVGIGLRFYQKAYNNLTDEENKYIMTGEGHGDLVGDGLRLVGMHLYPNLNAGIKVGFLFKINTTTINHSKSS